MNQSPQNLFSFSCVRPLPHLDGEWCLGCLRCAKLRHPLLLWEVETLGQRHRDVSVLLGEMSYAPCQVKLPGIGSYCTRSSPASTWRITLSVYQRWGMAVTCGVCPTEPFRPCLQAWLGCISSERTFGPLFQRQRVWSCGEI